MITLKDARKIIAAAESKATEIGQPMNIAVADAGGNLIAHCPRAYGWSMAGQHRYLDQEGVYLASLRHLD